MTLVGSGAMFFSLFCSFVVSTTTHLLWLPKQSSSWAIIFKFSRVQLRPHWRRRRKKRQQRTWRQNSKPPLPHLRFVVMLIRGSEYYPTDIFESLVFFGGNGSEARQCNVVIVGSLLLPLLLLLLWPLAIYSDVVRTWPSMAGPLAANKACMIVIK